MFKIFKSRSILSLLLVFAMTLSLLPGTAFATDTDTGEHIHTEDCSHEEESLEESEDSSEETSSTEETSEDSTPSEEVSEDTTPAEEPSTEETSEEEVPEEPVPEEEVTQPVYSGTVGESAVLWSFNPSNGQLFITGSGGCETFRSADDQPWAHLRTEIREVWFNTPDALSISNLAYWFDGCTALYAAEIPYTTLMIGERAFANCPNLEELKLYYYDEDNFEIAPSAFVSNTKVNMRISLITEQQLATHKVVAYDWENCNREVYFFDVYSILPLPNCGLGTCTCTGTCDWYYGYTPIDAYEHNRWVFCTGCDGSFGVGVRDHSFASNGYCSDCGYYGGSSGGGSSGGGGYVEPSYPSVCYHYYTSYVWITACEYNEYCDDCGAYVNSGVMHGTYSYGSWEYYTTSQHRRSYACNDCGEGSYSYASHSTTTKYSNYSSTQHTKGSYCSTCSSYVGSTTKESHSFTYGSWTNYDGTQHRRTKTCSSCGYSTYEYANHSLTYGSYSSYNASQHRRKVSCSCGYSTYEYVDHTITNGSWTSASDTQHSRTKSCSVCSYSTTETASHSITNGTWSSISATQHQRTNKCSSCNYSKTEKASHSISSTAWKSISDTQHERTNSCATCKYSAVEKASHSLTNGSWTSYNDTQHRRTKTCSCGYSTYEYGDHTITTTAWKNASATQHSRTHSCGTCAYSKTEMQNHSITSTAWKSVDDAKHTRTNSCSCGYSAVETVAHSFTYGAWTSKSATQHQRTKSCSCGYSTIEVASHSITNSAWTSISEENHQRTNSCSCGYSVKETVAHADGNADDYCDSCNYLMTRFSVTIPATLSLTVSKSGKVYAASSAVIVNNSTDVVCVTGITLKSANGWTIVPYATNMANRKVDSKVIGFSINSAKSARTGTSEALTLSSGWNIAKGASLALNYDAVVSASSEPIKEQVLTVVFVVDWAK